MARVNLFLKDELLRAVDQEAGESSLNRSAFVQEALKRYLIEQKRTREEAEARRRMETACHKMDALAAKFGEWDGLSTIRAFRDASWRGQEQ